MSPILQEVILFKLRKKCCRGHWIMKIMWCIIQFPPATPVIPLWPTNNTMKTLLFNAFLALQRSGRSTRSHRQIFTLNSFHSKRLQMHSKMTLTLTILNLSLSAHLINTAYNLDNVYWLWYSAECPVYCVYWIDWLTWILVYQEKKRQCRQNLKWNTNRHTALTADVDKTTSYSEVIFSGSLFWVFQRIHCMVVFHFSI